MFEEVKSVIIDVLGVSEDEVTPEASLQMTLAQIHLMQ